DQRVHRGRLDVALIDGVPRTPVVDVDEADVLLETRRKQRRVLRSEADDDAWLAAPFGQVRVRLAANRDDTGAARDVLIGLCIECDEGERAEQADEPAQLHE